MINIDVTDTFLQNFGSHSLIGYMTANGLFNHINQRIQLIFPQTNNEYKKKHGPRDYIINEHNIPLLIKDILFLKNQGFDICVTMPETYIDR